MAKPRSKVLDYLVYLVVRVLVCVLQSLSYEAARAFAAGLAWLAYHVDRRHREVALDNLRHAFPGRFTPEELNGLVKKVYLHFCLVVVEMVQLPRRLHSNNWRKHVALPQPQEFANGLLADRPLLLVTGHFGNWEIGGYTLSLCGFHAHAIARKLDNPYLHGFLRSFRESTGQRLLDKHGDFEKLGAVLESRGIVATLGDQDAGQNGLFVDFFGRPASTHKAMALLCLQYGAPIQVIGVPRVGEPFQFQIVVEDTILPEEYAERPDAVRAITERLTAALERIVHRHPEQYFWLHRRWKHQPKLRKRAA